MAMLKPGDLVWAKMKGHPPWPAMILSTADVPLPCPSGKQPVLFYGTNETAFLKPNELFAYEHNRAKYEQPRKLKGFNQAIREIRREAGIDEDADFDERFPVAAAGTPKRAPLAGGPAKTPDVTENEDDFVSSDDEPLVVSSPTAKLLKAEPGSSSVVTPTSAKSGVPSSSKSSALTTETSSVLTSPSESSRGRQRKPNKILGDFVVERPKKRKETENNSDGHRSTAKMPKTEPASTISKAAALSMDYDEAESADALMTPVLPSVTTVVNDSAMDAAKTTTTTAHKKHIRRDGSKTETTTSHSTRDSTTLNIVSLGCSGEDSGPEETSGSGRLRQSGRVPKKKSFGDGFLPTEQALNARGGVVKTEAVVLQELTPTAPRADDGFEEVSVTVQAAESSPTGGQTDGGTSDRKSVPPLSLARCQKDAIPGESPLSKKKRKKLSDALKLYSKLKKDKKKRKAETETPPATPPVYKVIAGAVTPSPHVLASPSEDGDKRCIKCNTGYCKVAKNGDDVWRYRCTKCRAYNGRVDGHKGKRSNEPPVEDEDLYTTDTAEQPSGSKRKAKPASAFEEWQESMKREQLKKADRKRQKEKQTVATVSKAPVTPLTPVTSQGDEKDDDGFEEEEVTIHQEISDRRPSSTARGVSSGLSEDGQQSPLDSSTIAIEVVSSGDELRRSGRKKTPSVRHRAMEEMNSPRALRYCTECDSLVRPQLCGRHQRWRCINKQCRVWYEWVAKGDILPVPLGQSPTDPIVVDYSQLHTEKTGRRSKTPQSARAPTTKRDEDENEERQTSPMDDDEDASDAEERSRSPSATFSSAAYTVKPDATQAAASSGSILDDIAVIKGGKSSSKTERRLAKEQRRVEKQRLKELKKEQKRKTKLEIQGTSAVQLAMSPKVVVQRLGSPTVVSVQSADERNDDAGDQPKSVDVVSGSNVDLPKALKEAAEEPKSAEKDTDFGALHRYLERKQQEKGKTSAKRKSSAADKESKERSVSRQSGSIDVDDDDDDVDFDADVGRKTTGRGAPLRIKLGSKRKSKAKAKKQQTVKQPKKSTPKPSTAAKTMNPFVKPFIQQSSASDIDEPPRSPSPLPESALAFRPSYVEGRSRWWLMSTTAPPRRPPSAPPLPFVHAPIDSAALFRLIGDNLTQLGHNAAQLGVSADSAGSVRGCVDLMMDSLMASFGPLLTLADVLPSTAVLRHSQRCRLWEATVTHAPII